MERTEQALHRLMSDDEAFQAEAEGDVRINGNDLIQDMHVFPDIHLRWLSILALAEDMAFSLKNHLATVKADSATRWRTIANTGPKMTEAAIAEKVATDPAVLGVQDEHSAAVARVNRLKAVEQSLSDKKDLLQSINARQCREFAVMNLSSRT